MLEARSSDNYCRENLKSCIGNVCGCILCCHVVNKLEISEDVAQVYNNNEHMLYGT